MLAIDPARPLTRFQVRLLRVIRCGPLTVTELRRCFHARGDAVRLGVHILCQAGFAARRAGRLDVTAAGRWYLDRAAAAPTPTAAMATRPRWSLIRFFRRS
jgi:hypothetical protein